MIADVKSRRVLLVNSRNEVVGWQDFHGNIYDAHGNCEGHIDGGEARMW